MSFAWLSRAAIEAMHDEQIAEHGGLAGLRDENALEAALARPQNKFAYGEADIFELAASQLFALARSDPFHDGSKRTAFLACYVFLDINGIEIVASNAGVYELVMGVAAGIIEEPAIGDWLRQHSKVTG